MSSEVNKMINLVTNVITENQKTSPREVLTTSGQTQRDQVEINRTLQRGILQIPIDLPTTDQGVTFSLIQKSLSWKYPTGGKNSLYLQTSQIRD
jgi:hypothetical protein